MADYLPMPMERCFPFGVVLLVSGRATGLGVCLFLVGRRLEDERGGRGACHVGLSMRWRSFLCAVFNELHQEKRSSAKGERRSVSWICLRHGFHVEGMVSNRFPIGMDGSVSMDIDAPQRKMRMHDRLHESRMNRC